MNNFFRFLRFAAFMVLMMAWIIPSMAQTPPSSGLYYIANYHDASPHYNPSTIATNYYLVPASTCDGENVLDEQWALKEGSTYNHNKPLLTTYHTNKDNPHSFDCEPDFNSIWEISTEVVDNVTYYRFKHWLTGKYIVYNTPDNTNRRAFHLESSNDPNSFDGKDLFEISFVNNTDVSDVNSYNIRSKNLTTGHRFMNPSKGNKNFYYGIDFDGVLMAGLMGVYNNSADNGSKWYFEPATITQPVITFDNTTNTVTMTCTIEDATIYYTLDGSEPSSSSIPYSDGGFVQNTPTNIRAIALFNGVYSNVTTYNLQKTATPAFSLNTNTNVVTITSTTGASIYYSIGTENTPSVGVNLYTAPFEFPYANTNQPLKAIAVKEGWINSDLKEQTIILYCRMPIISFNNSTQQVTLSCNDAEATMYYTTDGSTPDPSQSGTTQYSGTPISVTSECTVKAIATHAGYLNSNVAIWSNDYSQKYLTFDILSSGTLKWKSNGSGATKTISYSINDGEWTDITSSSSATISVSEGDVVRFKGSNTRYCEADKNNYSGFANGTATFNISGNIMSLTEGDNFTNVTTLPGTWTFTQLFKQSRCISAENLILPATTMTESCYRSMFSKCYTLEKAPELPATELANSCYSYMFEDCAITSAPELPAPTLVSECYKNMFTGCTSLNYIKCLATTKPSGCLSDWVKNVSPIGTFIKGNVDWSNGNSGIPYGWAINKLPNPVIACDGESIMITCQTYGASTKYRLGGTGSYSLYSEPIAIHENTVVEAYTEKDGLQSNTVSETCNTFKSYKFAGMKITPGPLYYGSNGYKIKDSWNYDSYSLNYGKTVGSTYFSFIELGQLFESSVFSTSDGDIEKVLDPLDGWRVPTNAEWASILGTTRSGSTVNGSSSKHYAMIQLTTGVTGLLIFPDGETISGEALSYMDITTPNTGITEEQLNEYLSKGCIFLPGSGYYDSSQHTWNNEHYYYWSSTENNSSTGYDLYFKPSNTISSDDNKNKETCYFPVYLVKAAADEATRLLRTWTYNNHEVELPYSVNAEDGHSSNYAKSKFNFTTEVMVKESQPTYLWFQHADQSADIFVNNKKVETHWGGYNAFFTDITDAVKPGKNIIMVTLNNASRDYLAPCAGDFNFNATLGEVKLISSPVVPSPDYGYDGFHITSTVTAESATITVKTSVPTNATVTCSIKGTNCDYTNTQTGEGEITFTKTITEPHLWNGTLDPYLYDVTLTIAKDGVVYHKFQRGYGFRFYEYFVDNENPANSRFKLNGSPYLLRGVCMHHDLEGKANALTAEDIDNDFELLKELGCSFVRLAHYPHPKEVYDWCDKLGIIVQTEVPWVNNAQTTQPADYYNHLADQYRDMVNQHYNHPCIMFWGLSNETTTEKNTESKNFIKTKIENYTSIIKGLDPERWVGYVMSHSIDNPSGYYNDPNVDWFGCNIYVGWYIDTDLNNPSGHLNTRLNKTLTRLSKPLAFSEYGCGGTPSCHSDDFMTTTTRGNHERHDIEYQMWLHEGHIAAIKNKPELLFTSQWQLFDIAVSGRTEGYKVSLDGETVYDNDELKRLNNKGLVERDHKTKKDTYYLYKAWWNPTSNYFVHICGKDYEKLTNRVIKCYTNDNGPFSLYINNVLIDTKSASNYIVLFDEQNFNPGDVVRVNGATSNDTFTLPIYEEDYVFTTKGKWNDAANWSPTVPAAARNVTINAACTIPASYTAKINNITIGESGNLTIADGGQLILPNNTTSVQATVQNSTVASTETKDYVSQWNAISSPVDNVAISSFRKGTHNVYRYDEQTVVWQEYRNSANNFENLQNGRGYIYRSSEAGIEFTGNIITGDKDGLVTCPDLSYACYDNNYRGFNLIGNPFTHDITWANLSTENISNDGFFLLGTNGEWTAQTTSGTIAPMKAFLVQATDANPVVKIANSVVVGSKGNDNRYGNDQILFTVFNSEYSDVAYAIFREGYGLNKIEHHNSDIPMLYIINNYKDYAIAAMPDNTSVINLGFNATKMGQYTLSVKAEGKYSYMHLYDKLTGSDTDMLFDNSYTFVGSPSDRKDRFVLRLNYNAANIDTESDIFAYQSGSDIIVSGEGELQIFDITGRLVMTTTINGVKSINVATQGVYIFRLVGTEIKTQKIVIR